MTRLTRLTRQSLSLDGQWAFAFAPDAPVPEVDSVSHSSDCPDTDDWRTVTVPGPWQAQFDDLCLSTGTAWYRRTVTVPGEWRNDERILLHFGAVMYYCQVWWGDHYLGEHEGGYLPFEMEITEMAHPGESAELTVRVVMPSNDPERYARFPFAEFPHGKQSWYGPLGGIWQSVHLEQRSQDYLTHLRLTPSVAEEGGALAVDIGLSRALKDGETITVTVLDPAGEICAQERVNETTVVLPIANPDLWDLETPHLYTVTVSWQGDELTDTCGFRTVETKAGQIWLNGRPIYLRGVLDQDYYPDMLATPPSQEYLEDQFRQAKAMGLNCMRIHIKVGDPRYYAAADKVGILLWSELPNWHLLTEAAKERISQTLQAMILRDWNHPSLIIWTIVNEDWGMELVSNPDHRAWLAEMMEWTRKLDPNRLIVDNSPCFPNFHVDSDLDDFHFYAGMPDSRHQWDRWMDEMAERRDFLYAPDYQENRLKGAPLIVSEFGNWGLPDLDSLLAYYGGEPWWFETGWDWSSGDVYPHGVMNRFRAMHLDKTFGDFRELARISQASQKAALKYEIESMRRREAINGYVITEWTDVLWECNGLLDMARTPKDFVPDLNQINADTVIMPELSRWSFWSDESVTVPIQLSHYGAEPLAGYRVEVSLLLDGEDRGRKEEDAEKKSEDEEARTITAQDGIHAEPGTVQQLSPVTLSSLPPVKKPVRATLIVTLSTSDGGVINRNETPIALFPREEAREETSARITCFDPELARQLQVAGYAVESQLDPALPLVVRHMDGLGRRFAEEGGRVLVLAEGTDAIQTHLPRFGINLQKRAFTPWNGDWASSLAWYRRDRFAADLPADGWLDFTCAGVVPELVITDVRGQEWERNVLAGLFVGWLQRPAALVQRFPLGKGEMLISTLKLGDRLSEDPVAAHFFAEHLRVLRPKQG